MTAIPFHPGTPPPAPVSTNRTAGVKSRPGQEVDPTAFQKVLDARVQPDRLRFSGHAAKRLNMRGIQFTPQGLDRIEQAVDKARDKGCRDALVLAGGLALVVSVENRTVVTVMSRDNMQESVVTNIDSAVFA